eukprot:4060695-Amphidinium_carterae.1
MPQRATTHASLIARAVQSSKVAHQQHGPQERFVNLKEFLKKQSEQIKIPDEQNQFATQKPRLN